MIYLNFHGVGPIPRAIEGGEHNCWLEETAFLAVLDSVRHHPHVRLTVDDGNASDHEIILPALLQRGLRAAFFVCSDRLDQPTFLSRAQVRELQAQGMTIGSHGAAHVPWRRLPPGQLEQELTGSRRRLEEVCGKPVDTAACPFGSYGRRALAELRRAGYREVYTSDGGSASESQWLRARTTVTRTLPTQAIEQLVRHGSAGLMQPVIEARKLIKRLRS